MRTRLLASIAVLAAVLLTPSAAFADVGKPVITTPAVSPFATSVSPVNLAWSDVPDEVYYRVFRADADCSTNLANVSGDLPFDTPGYADAPPGEGTYCYYVQADDILSTTNSDPVLVTYDVTLPTGSLTTPASGATLSTPVSVTASAGDVGGSGVAGVEFFATPTAFPGNWVSIGTDTTSPYAISWSPSNDTYDVHAVITDKAGNSVTTLDAVGVVVDGTPPTGAVTAPAPGGLLHGAVNGLTADASDVGTSVALVTFERSNGGGWTTIGTDSSAPYTANWNTTGLNGSFNVHVLVTDQAGNPFESAPVAVTVDNTAPSGTLTAPAAGAAIRGTIVADANASDPGGSGVTSVQFQRSPAGAGTWTTYDTDSVAPYHGTLDTTVPGDGLYDLRVLVTDAATNSAASALVTGVRFDNTPPTGSLTSPLAGAVVRGSITADAGASDPGGSGVTSVAFQRSPAGAGTWTTYDTDSVAPYHGTLDTTVPGDGLYDLRVLVTDAAANTTAGATVAGVRIDNTAPTVTLGGVAGSSNVRGTLALTALPADAGSGVLSVTFGRRPAGSSGAYTTIGAPDTTGPDYSVLFNTTGVSDGDYQIQALATDVAGNTASDQVTNVRVDNHAPDAPSLPAGLSPVSAAPTITFSASTDQLFGGVASGLDHYDVYRDGAKVNAAPIDGTVAGPYTWSDVTGQSTVPAAGQNTYSYRVLAVDKAGNPSAQSPARLIVLDPTALSAPGSVAAAASPTSQRPQVSWTPPASVPFTLDHYDVFRNGGTTPVGVVLAPATTFTDTTVSLADGTYTYQVVAASAGDATLGVASGAVAVMYDTTAPTAPGGVAASAALDGSVNVGWVAASDGAGSGIARYVARRSLTATPPATVADGDATCQGTATSCSDATALNGKLYSYAVFAVDAAGNTSVAGGSTAVTARDQIAPAAPKGLAATPHDASVDLRWTAAAADDDVAGYVLVARLGTQAPASETDGTRVCGSIVAASTTCTAAGLTNGATYAFGLFALDEALNRSQAAVVNAAPNGKVNDTKPPAAVSRLRARVAGHKVTLTWKNPSDRDFDHVVITASARKPAARAAAKRVYSGKGTRTTTRLAAGQSRWFVVIAYDDAGNASKPASVHAAVAAPSMFGPAPRARVHGAVRLSWPVVKGARYYNVQLYAGKQRILVSWPAGHALTLPRAKLSPGKKYTWYVWPGLGAKAKAHYGKLIGRNVFTFTG